MEERSYSIYIMTNKLDTVLYTGVTNDLARRVLEHKRKLIPGFTSRYNITKLVYHDETSDIYSAIEREKEIKEWKREKKERLINEMNPVWRDLYEELLN